MFNMYISVADYWMFIDNSKTPFEVLAEGIINEISVNNNKIWTKLKSIYYGD